MSNDAPGLTHDADSDGNADVTQHKLLAMTGTNECDVKERHRRRESRLLLSVRAGGNAEIFVGSESGQTDEGSRDLTMSSDFPLLQQLPTGVRHRVKAVGIW